MHSALPLCTNQRLSEKGLGKITFPVIAFLTMCLYYNKALKKSQHNFFGNT